MRIAARAQKKARRTFIRTTLTPVAQGHKHKLAKSKMYVPFNEHEALPYTTPEQHHHISSSRNFSLHVSWLTKHANDPATVSEKCQSACNGMVRHGTFGRLGSASNMWQREFDAVPSCLKL
jgi:hypothetical protein